ncbi:cell wall-binding protein [Bacillus phage vB_BceM-HSE3]|nr:cell wall-binding protein [Bacillus phage vB_BceM-HSE3]
MYRKISIKKLAIVFGVAYVATFGGLKLLAPEEEPRPVTPVSEIPTQTYQLNGDPQQLLSSGLVQPNYRTLVAHTTAYTNTPDENGGTYNGRVLTKIGYDITDEIYYEGYKIIATDPSVIPLYSIVRIHHEDGSTEDCIAIDIGGAIKGEEIDYLMDDKDAMWDFGRQNLKVEILREGIGA